MTGSSHDGWKGFQLIPDDLLFFRDGKPSSIGYDHYHRSLFPPHPWTLYGAVRTARLVAAGIDLSQIHRGLWSRLDPTLRDELGEWGGFGTLEFRGPWLVENGEVLLPAPRDLLLRTARPDPRTIVRRRTAVAPTAPRIEEVRRLRLLRGDDEQARPSKGHSHSMDLLSLPDSGSGAAVEDFQPAASWWLRPAGMQAWRRGENPPAGAFVHSTQLWRDEPRTGVGLRSGTRMSADGKIYIFGFIRLLPGIRLGFEVRQTSLRPGRRLRLGGEGRTCWLEEGPGFPGFADAEAGGDADGPFRLALATPALFEGGALPSSASLNRAAKSTGAAGLEVPLAAAIVPGSIPVGGWDVAKGEPKPMRRAVPAGSVYCLRSPAGSGDAESLTCLDGTKLSDYPDESLAPQGFGLAVVGREPEETNHG